MTDVQIRTPTVRPAAAVIASMQEVLNKRYKHILTRRKFLTAWRGLRAELRNTIEYINFRDEVRRVARGMCTRCSRVGKLPHHKKPVSRYPELAVTVSNGEWLCEACHADEHPWLGGRN